MAAPRLRACATTVGTVHEHRPLRDDPGAASHAHRNQVVVSALKSENCLRVATSKFEVLPGRLKLSPQEGAPDSNP
jgi:hypothetical protein